MSNTTKHILDKIDSQETAKLALDLVRIPSPRGFESQVGEFIYDWMTKNGISAVKQEVAPGRNNVIGRLSGTGNGPNLIFNSHMDTGFGLPEDMWILGGPKTEFTQGWEDGDRLVGRSVINDKGPMAAFLTAAKAIKESNVKLRGDIILTCVIGEIGQTSVDEYQGSRYEGKGFGTRYLVSHGIVADYALVAEGTNYAISRAEAGDVWFKISIQGKGGVYTPFIERPFKFKDNPNAIVKAAPVITAIEEWAYRYQEENRFDFEDGTILPKVNIGAVRAGLGVRPTQTPGICNLYIDVRLVPEANVNSVREELAEVVRKCDVDFKIETYLYRAGHVGKNVGPLVDSVSKAHRQILGGEPKSVAAPYASMWRDLNVFNELGIPSVTYGPQSFSYQTLAGERVPALKKQDLENAAKIYALTALELCDCT